jgi:hypothetical protein
MAAINRGRPVGFAHVLACPYALVPGQGYVTRRNEAVPSCLIAGRSGKQFRANFSAIIPVPPEDRNLK